MYDRQTESWWQQADGTAIAGEFTGRELKQLPIQRSSWGEAARAFPDARVLHISHEGEEAVIPYEGLRKERIVELELGDSPAAVFFEVETASALDTPDIAQGRSVGSANAFLRTVGGRTLSFRIRLGQIYDRETMRRWNHLGEATSGPPLAGSRLVPLIAADHFWFSVWSFILRKE